MASTAPESLIAAARAAAQRELLGVADYFECASGSARGQNVVVDREGLLERLSGKEVTELLAGIEHAGGPKDVALFADGVARSRCEFGGIDDGAGARIGEMVLHWAMAALAGDGVSGENRLAKLVEGRGDVKRGARMAKDTGFTDRTSEIGIRKFLVARGDVVGVPAP